MYFRRHARYVFMFLSLLIIFFLDGCTVYEGGAKAQVGLFSLESIFYNFGKITVRTTGTQEIKVSNDSDASADISRVLISPATFVVSRGDCPDSLPAKKSCQLRVEFTPAEVGVVTGRLNFSGTNISAALMGEGLADPNAVTNALVLDKKAYDFGTIAQNGASAPVPVQISNGSAAPILLAATIVGPFFISFQTSPKPCPVPPAPLPANQSCIHLLQMSSSVLGPASGSINFGTDPAAAPAVATLAGNVVASGSLLPPAGLSAAAAKAGDTITISGTNLAAVTSVTFGSVSAKFSLGTDTQMTAVIPASLAAGNVTVTVTNSAGPGSFSYNVNPPAPLSPANLSATAGRAGDSITISGSNLAAVTSVSFGANVARFSLGTASQITAVIPATLTAGTVTVTVSNSAGPGSFSYNVNPPAPLAPANLSATAGRAGDSITISGSNLSAVMSVSFGATVASFSLGTASQITAVVPAGLSGTMTVTVSNSAGPGTFSCTISPPAVLAPANLSATAGRAGDSITISGSNLSAVTSVSFGATVASFSLGTASQITAVIPAGLSGTVTVTVSNSAGPGTFSYTISPPAVPAPANLTFSSPNPRIGDSIVLSGNNISGAQSIVIGGQPVTNFDPAGPTISITVPSVAAGLTTVTLTTAGGPTSASLTIRPAAFPYDLVVAGTEVPNPQVWGTKLSNQSEVGFDLPVGGFIKPVVAEIKNQNGEQCVFALGLDSTPFVTRLTASWSPLTQVIAAGLKFMYPVTDGAGNKVLFGIGMDDQVYRVNLDPMTCLASGAFALVAPGSVRGLAVGTNLAGALRVVVIGWNDFIYYTTPNANLTASSYTAGDATTAVRYISFGSDNSLRQRVLYAVKKSDNSIIEAPLQLDSGLTSAGAYSVIVPGGANLPGAITALAAGNEPGTGNSVVYFLVNNLVYSSRYTSVWSGAQLAGFSTVSSLWLPH